MQPEPDTPRRRPIGGKKEGRMQLPPALVERAIQCPACQSAAVAEREAIAPVVASGVLPHQAPLCDRHLHLAIRSGLPAHALLTGIDAAIESLGTHNSTSLREPEGQCICCAAMSGAAQQALSDDTEASLCIPHLIAAFEALSDTERTARIQRFVVAGRSLEAELDDLIRKADYRFRDEQRGSESDAWLRVLALIAGVPRLPNLQGGDHEPVGSP